MADAPPPETVRVGDLATTPCRQCSSPGRNPMQDVTSNDRCNMLSNLNATTSWLESVYPARWCIVYGTLLGWFGGRSLIPWDNDCDVILWDVGGKRQALESITDRIS